MSLKLEVMDGGDKLLLEIRERFPALQSVVCEWIAEGLMSEARKTLPSAKTQILAQQALNLLQEVGRPAEKHHYRYEVICPDCQTDLSKEPDTIELELTVAGASITRWTALEPTGELIDVDGAVAMGCHSQTRCRQCDLDLEITRISE